MRGIATVLVVLLHAGIPYMTKPLPHLAWPARDLHPCPIVDGLSWLTECFIMPLFFVLAGFFSNGLLISRGERNFLTGRTKRLLTTQLVAALFILPPCLFIWSLGWVADGLYVPEDVLNTGMPPELEADLYGFSHLWFLQNLYIYCLMLCGLSWWMKRRARLSSGRIEHSSAWFQSVDGILKSAWKPLVPVIPSAVILYFDPRIVIGFYQSFTPVVSKLFYYAIPFFMGTILYRHRTCLKVHSCFGKSYLLVAALLFTALLPLIHEHTTVALTGVRLMLLAGLMSLFAWFSVFGLFALAIQFEHAQNAVTRYLAESSFWIYLIHLPFVALAQIAIAQLPIPTIAKFLLSALIALSLSLMTYQAFVRTKWLGDFLSGHSRSRLVQHVESESVCSRTPCDVTPEVSIPTIPFIPMPHRGMIDSVSASAVRDLPKMRRLG